MLRTYTRQTQAWRQAYGEQVCSSSSSNTHLHHRDRGATLCTIGNVGGTYIHKCPMHTTTTLTTLLRRLRSTHFLLFCHPYWFASSIKYDRRCDLNAQSGFRPHSSCCKVCRGRRGRMPPWWPTRRIRARPRVLGTLKHSYLETQFQQQPPWS